MDQVVAELEDTEKVSYGNLSNIDEGERMREARPNRATLQIEQLCCLCWFSGADVPVNILHAFTKSAVIANTFVA